MLTDITIGQFFPGTSVLHRMDPRTKLLLLIALMAAIFIFDTPGGYAVLTGGLVEGSLVHVSAVAPPSLVDSRLHVLDPSVLDAGGGFFPRLDF